MEVECKYQLGYWYIFTSGERIPMYMKKLGYDTFSNV